ncbi:hypothetical protein ESCO_002001 [Escovopsis weberi]|uniref:Thioredoxin domain-containing protein n=1 Tax=Escovopsis weberi TaxID=150374 RepID=A0A0M8N8P9_ESCWE|nr:hypothetical protein ESCO_002001 [Escovopsis weberi]
MPLIDADAPPTAIDDTHYVVYFASGETPWCPDCLKALPALKSVFGPDSAPKAYLVRVGDRAEWKGLSGQQNEYRDEPYNIRCVPTTVKIVNTVG